MSTEVSVQDAFHGIAHPKKRAYLRALVEVGGNVTRACEVAEISRRTPYQWKEDDPEFRELLPVAEAMAADHLEAEAFRRAYEGVEEPVGFYKGEPSAYVQRYSDTLMIFLLKGAKPDKYAERHQHTGKDGERLRFTLDIGDVPSTNGARPDTPQIEAGDGDE